MKQINEYSQEVVDRFLRSKGWDPRHIDRNRRMAFTKTKEFQMFASRMSEETVDESCECNAKKREMSKSARIIKSLYKRKRMQKEELYDHEKDKKGPGTNVKKAKVTVGDKQLGDDKSDAAAILSGGTTLTGQKRDTVMIDPVLKKAKPGAQNSLTDNNNK
jgi:hypothetical protein